MHLALSVEVEPVVTVSRPTLAGNQPNINEHGNLHFSSQVITTPSPRTGGFREAPRGLLREGRGRHQDYLVQLQIGLVPQPTPA